MAEQLPLFLPDSNWAPPQGALPLPRGERIALDTETRDRGLERGRGAGWFASDGYICGVSMAWSGGALYVPMRHPDTENRSPEEVIPWVEELCRHNEVYFHHADYDLGWLRAEGMRVWPERFHDTYIMAVMADERRMSYRLDDLCTWQGVPGKDEQLLKEWAAAFGIKASEVKKNLWRMAARYVGPYAEQDTRATLALAQKLWPLLEAEKLVEAYTLERDLVQVVHDMRARGIRVDVDEAERVQASVRAMQTEELSEFSRRAGRRVTIETVRSANKLAELFDAEQIPYPRTTKTKQPSFSKEWLSKSDHWLAKAVVRVRKLEDLSEKFLGEYILKFEHRGRVHPEINQLRDEDENGGRGTRTYRFSYSNPPLQQMPSPDKDPELATLVRSVFLPDGDLWGAFDCSQQEPRLAVHYATICKIKGAQEVADKYNSGQRVDFHTLVSELTGLKRAYGKIISLGMMYGMGNEKLLKSLGVTEEEAEAILSKYHGLLPWVKGLGEFCSRMASDRGFIRLIDGARIRFSLWEPARGRGNYEMLPLEQAHSRWPGERLKRAQTHSAMNGLIQGSAARQIKKAMVMCHRAGILPLVQVHDELGSNVNSRRDCEDMVEIMANAVPLVIPMAVDGELGPNWGKAKTDYRQMFKEAA